MEKIVVLLEDQEGKLLETEVVGGYLGGGWAVTVARRVGLGWNKIDDDLS